MFPEFQFMWLAEETRKNLPLELDFEHEAHNCERVARMFSHFDFLKVKVTWFEGRASGRRSSVQAQLLHPRQILNVYRSF